jgi:hypothetical protein
MTNTPDPSTPPYLDLPERRLLPPQPPQMNEAGYQAPILARA